MDEVVAPDEPGVHSGGLDFGDGKAFGLEGGVELLVGGDESILGAAGDPEKLEVCGFRVEVGEVDGLHGVDGGAEAADVGEESGVVKAR